MLAFQYTVINVVAAAAVSESFHSPGSLAFGPSSVGIRLPHKEASGFLNRYIHSHGYLGLRDELVEGAWDSKQWKCGLLRSEGLLAWMPSLL
ncbi:hypothetical protein BD309DRAFT_965122 [Dichomitus squalens]|nr:hypothetical protein BD309DRAFT_965122 [Dichomitus squalens]